MSARNKSAISVLPVGQEPKKPRRSEGPQFKMLVRPQAGGHPLVGVEFTTLKDLSEWQHEHFEGEVARLAGVAARLLTRALSGRKTDENLGNDLLGLAKRFVAAVALALDAQPAAEGAGSQQRTVSDDTFIDQRSGLIPKEVFLRLHREGAFATKKVGKRILARWGDVRRAVEGSVKERRRTMKTTAPADDLDDLRREIGLEPKDGR